MMHGLLSAPDATIVTAFITAIVTLLGLTYRKAHVVGTEVSAVAEEARTAVTEARDEATGARRAAAAVRSELQPNGGSTLRDAIDRLERGQVSIGKLADRLAETADRVDERTLMLDRRLSVLDRRLNHTAAALDERLKAIEKIVRP